MRVQVYRNLNNGLISIQDLSTGLVLGHASAVDMEEANFIVREAGRQQVIREQRKNVHAFEDRQLQRAIEKEEAMV